MKTIIVTITTHPKGLSCRKGKYKGVVQKAKSTQTQSLCTVLSAPTLQTAGLGAADGDTAPLAGGEPCGEQYPAWETWRENYNSY